MKQISYILLLLMMSLPVNAFVHASGRNIVDADGNPALMRGMGLGGWLVPEGYMLHTPGMGSPTSIRGQIVDVLGESGAAEFYAAYHNNYVTRADIAELAEWGFDHVRMPFHYNMFSPARGVWSDWGFEVTDSLIAWCADVGMHVVLDMHCAPGGQNGGPISDSDGTARLWMADSNKAHTIEIWERIAQRYVDEPWVGGYDLLNEPVLPDGVSSYDLRSLYVNIRNVIRNVDNNHVLFIEGNWYATDFTGLSPIFDVNMSYSFHKYWSTNDQGSIQSYINLRNSTNAPLWMGESGENSNTWFYDAVQLHEANNIGWCWWTTKKVDTITSPYSAARPAGYDQLLNYWEGTAPKPSAAFSYAVLMELADNLRSENCRFSPGAVASWFSPVFATLNMPFKEHNIPGTILTADYDIGAQGIAYQDDVYETVHWDNYTAWNNGHQYRNDGVDIQIGTSGIPHVGWTTQGEWLKYTVIAEHGGIYNLSMEFASTSYSGQVRLFLDGQLLTNISETPITGEWHIFSEALVEGLDISVGEHELKLQILEAGFNMRAMVFTLDSAYISPQTPGSFSLWQNYPNPFNGGTRIPVTNLTDDPLNLEILDIRGALVNTFTIDKQSGDTYVDWRGMDVEGNFVPAGVYLYRALHGNVQEVGKMMYLP